MPRVSAFRGIVITMYFGDHPPPHFHLRYGEEEARIEIGSGEIIGGALSNRVLRLVREWRDMRGAELESNWRRVTRNEEPEWIEPLP